MADRRAELVRMPDKRPRNTTQIVYELGHDYTTIHNHLDVLIENNVVERTDDDYAAVYMFTDQAQAYWDTVEESLDHEDNDHEFGRNSDRTFGDRGLGEQR
ncbi:MAG: ArsR family transcriptional regulator [Halorhabdus sp.]